MRLIDADTLIRELNEKIGCRTDINKIICGMTVYEPAIVQPQWIPVTERLPEKLVPVLIQHTYMEYAGISIGYITTYGYWEWFGYFMGDDMLHRPPVDGLICPGSEYVIAWMPLPEPYNPEGVEDRNE